MRYLQLIAQHWLSLFFFTVVMAAGAMGLSFIPEQLYESEVELLIVQNNVNSDTYTAQRAAEKLGTNLGTVVHSFDFLQRVINAGYIDATLFSDVSKDKQKEWQRMVTTQVIPESSVIRVYGYGITPILAEDVAVGVSQVLTTNAEDYHGAGETVTIRKITGPITSVRPVKPNIVLNTVAGGVLGFMLVYTFHLLRFENKRIKEEEALQQQMLQYQVAGNQLNSPNVGHNNDFSQDVFPIGPPEYKVLDRFPTDGYAFGETVENSEDEATSMQDHM